MRRITMPDERVRPLFAARGADERPSVRELERNSTNLKAWLQAVSTAAALIAFVWAMGAIA